MFHLKQHLLHLITTIYINIFTINITSDELTTTVKHLAAAPPKDKNTVINDNYPVSLFLIL